ncbi:MAG: DUF4147 domain-containing protein [Chloroflexi bacterium]|nr:DUF4147 domain-containing protein [Chloroflexota bacterium]
MHASRGADRQHLNTGDYRSVCARIKLAVIKNRAEIATTRSRMQALDIIEAGIMSVQPRSLMRSALHWDDSTRSLTVCGDRYRCDRGRLFVIGGGKASGRMAETLEEMLPPRLICAGVVTCKSIPEGFQERSIRLIPAGHPVPDESGVAAVERMLALATDYSTGASDLVVCLISGGGSALMPCPVDGVSLSHIQSVTSLLLHCGADIHQINTVRKHLSRIAGGNLGRAFSPARVISLIISDVIGNDLSVIASGPTSPDPSTFGDAWRIILDHGLLDRVPPAVLNHIKKGCQGLAPETPKSLDNCHNYLIGDSRIALEAMAAAANRLGRRPLIVTSEMKGDTETAARALALQVSRTARAGHDVLLLGGETTPTLPDTHGKGGRNQHFAAAFLAAQRRFPGQWTLVAAGTDGSDFLPDVAGAIVDDQTARDMTDAELRSYVKGFDSWSLFERTRSHIVTGDTGTNVGDVVACLLEQG